MVHSMISVCVCLYEGLYEFKCLQMFVRLLLAILGQSLIFQPFGS